MNNATKKTIKWVLITLVSSGVFVCMFVAGFYGAWQIDKHFYLSPKQHRFLVCISSFKRPLLLSGQLLRLKYQTYQNFDISLSIKGVPEDGAKKTFMQEWQPMIDSGKLTLRFDTNKMQLSNFLDTVRNVDIEKYDYFCKMDDDDWYTPDYLEDVNRWLNKEPNIILSKTLNAVYLRNGDDEVDMGVNRTPLSGSTICFSKALLKKVMLLEDNPAALEPKYPRSEVYMLRVRAEDKMIDDLSGLYGKKQIRRSRKFKVLFGQQYPSVTRGGGYLK